MSLSIELLNAAWQQSNLSQLPTDNCWFERLEWGISSVGRAFEWHSKGQGFESPILHLPYKDLRQVVGGHGVK